MPVVDEPNIPGPGTNGRRLICITAAQRAGTTALQHALKAAGMMSFGEIFHPEPLPDAAGAFLTFAREHDIRLTDTVSRTSVTAIAERYLAWLRTLAGPRHFLIDVKFNSWCVLTPWWRYPRSEPFFLSYLKRERALMLLIWRENLADQLLSQFIALEFGVWHNLTPEKIAGRICRVPIARLKKLGAAIVRAESDMLDYLRDYPDKIVMRYEDLFEESYLSGKFLSALRQVAGIEVPDRTRVQVRQNSVPKREIVENYEEVLEAVRPLEETRIRKLAS